MAAPASRASALSRSWASAPAIFPALCLTIHRRDVQHHCQNDCAATRIGAAAAFSVSTAIILLAKLL
jgi:hypothetical protein